METNISWAMVGMLQAVPKTPLHERMKQENRLDDSMEAATNTSLEVNIIPKSMTREELVSGYYRLCKQLYSYENYAKRVIGTLREYSREPVIKMYFPKFYQVKILLKTFRHYLLTLDVGRMKFLLTILKYVLTEKPRFFYDAVVHLVAFKHLHAYVFENLGRAYTEKVAEFEHSALQSRQSLASAYEELRKYAASTRQKVTKAYDDMITQIGTLGHHAAAEYEDVRQRVGNLNQQAAHAYDDLRRQASDLSQRTVSEYGALRKRASSAISGQWLTAEFEELGKQLAAFNASVAKACEELRLRSLALSEQLAAIAT
jgi:hypothetical protein